MVYMYMDIHARQAGAHLFESRLGRAWAIWLQRDDEQRRKVESHTPHLLHPSPSTPLTSYTPHVLHPSPPTSLTFYTPQGGELHPLPSTPLTSDSPRLLHPLRSTPRKVESGYRCLAFLTNRLLGMCFRSWLAGAPAGGKSAAGRVSGRA